MTKKIRVAVVFGGESVEHEVSWQSARNVVNSIDKKKYNVTLVEINKQGNWMLHRDPRILENKNLSLLKSTTKTSDKNLASVSNLFNNSAEEKIDVVFPVLHGTFGEDGSIQGMLRMLHLPYVGSDVLSSAICMNKTITKRLLREAGIPVVDWMSFDQSEKSSILFEELKKRFGLPFFVKPANLGSSVGVRKIQTKQQLKKAITTIFSLDTALLVEKYIQGREIEVSVLGNEKPEASVPGEIRVNDHEFYSYEAKYLDENGAFLDIPAKLSPTLQKKFQTLAKETYKTLGCSGMARVDFFLQGEKIFVNEINTLPGFTSISMYPKLWEASGISYKNLISKLIHLAIEKYNKEKKIYSY